MHNRRNSIISQEQYENGLRVGTVLNINGRFPLRGVHADCGKDILLYVMKGSGMIGRPNSRSGLSAGSTMHLKHCESYYLKGQFAVYVLRV